MSGKKMKLLRKATLAASREEAQKAQSLLSNNPDPNEKRAAGLVVARRRFYRSAKKGYKAIPGALRDQVDLDKVMKP
jgi:hypothetical protein